MAKNFDVILLGPKEVKGGDSIPVRAVIVPLSKIGVRKKMAEQMNELITESYNLGTLDFPVLSGLAAMLDGKGMFEHNIGEFFLLYGRFEERFECENGKQTKRKMDEFIKGNRDYLKRIMDRSNLPRLHPLPYAVRNILAHKGRSRNKIDDNGEEIRTSIKLLKEWLND